MSQALNRNQTTRQTTLPSPKERNRPLFPLGQIVATNGVHKHLANGIDPAPYTQQHHCGLWGDVPPEDAQENDLSALNDFRVLSSFNISEQRVWIITEADRSSTTLLFPSEY